MSTPIQDASAAVDECHDLEIVLRSRIPLVNIETREEARVIDLCRRLVLALGKPLFKWSVTEGLRRLDLDLEAQRHNARPEEVLRQIKATTHAGIYLLLDFHPYLDDPLHVRLLKEIAQAYPALGHTIVFVSHAREVPAELRHLTARFDLALPGPQEIEQLIRDIANDWSARNQRRKVKTDRATLDRIVRNLGELTLSDARRLARRMIRDDGALTADDLSRLTDASAGFSGSGIEQAVVAALYSAHARGGAVDTAAVEAELAQTRPLSVLMEERIARLRAWAAHRTVSAD